MTSPYLEGPTRTIAKLRSVDRKRRIVRLMKLVERLDRAAITGLNSCDPREVSAGIDRQGEALCIQAMLNENENMLAALREIVADIEGGDHTTGHRIARVAINWATGEGT